MNGTRQLNNTIVKGGSQLKKYNIGLDIGTTSVGWAVVNPENYSVMRKGNKKLWGVRLFESAQPAADRRKFRSQRRRYQRRRERIKLLREEFSDEISKVDNQFFTRLDESFYHENDNKKTIKRSENETEKIRAYYKKYPTIYHLRFDLMNNPEKKDIRLVYLAIHHILKYRGNFLYQGNFNLNNLDMKEPLKSIFNMLNDYNVIEIENINHLPIDKLESILLLESKKDKKQYFNEISSPYLTKNISNELIKLILGEKATINKLLNLDIDEKIELSLEKYDEKYDEIVSKIGDLIEIIDEIKKLYDIVILKKFFKDNNTSLSSLMINRYETHKKDLKYLKEVLKNDKNLYKEVFCSKKELCLYEKYINNSLSYDEFIREIVKKLELVLNTEHEEKRKKEYLENIKTRIENGLFLPRITEVNNSIYPYQLNENELIQIIENQGKYYPFLKNKTKDEKYKLVKVLEFKIPYYVGPLNNTTDARNVQNLNSWVIKKQNNIKITPYNFNEVVDLEKSAEKFIKRMISHCTYLLSEPAMATNSIIYSKFKVMNELKQIKVNNKKLPIEWQKKIYHELFLKTSGNITNKLFINYLRQTNEFPMYSDSIKVEGYSKENGFANNMQSYYDFFGENGIFEKTKYTVENADEIIEWITIFEDKDILEKKIRDNYKLSEEQIKKVINKKYKGWSNLSKKLLTTKYYTNPMTNLKQSILDIMEETEKNFMQILCDEQFQFQKMIDEFNQINTTQKINYELVENLATSPATKKGIYQALKVVEEIVNYMGYDPENIMIEMARNEEEKKRTDTRKKYLQKLYENAKKNIEDYKKLSSELQKTEEISQKMFLYFIQEGKSLYSKEPISIENLNECEIDHIIPQTLIKDDSIDNKALVYKTENQEKSSSFVVPKKFRTDEHIIWWEHLKKNGLISAKKYNRLIRYKYSDEDIEGFINRQLVETRQICKHVANILNSYYKDTKIIYLHANLSHNYREKFELYKFREMNDYHHAHDAYLAAVLGEYKNTWLRKIDYEEIKELNSRFYKTKDYKNLKYGYVVNSLDNQFLLFDKKTGEVLFDPKELNKIIEKTLYCNDILISKKTEIKSGAFYQETKNSHKNIGKNDMPLKKGLSMKKYGSYTEIKPAYLSLIKYKGKQKIVSIPILIKEQAKKDKSIKDKYIREQLDLSNDDNYEILIDKIPFQQLLKYKGHLVYITGGSCELVSAVQLHISSKLLKKWRYVLNLILNNKNLPLDDNNNPILSDQEVEKQVDEIIDYLISKLKTHYPLYSSYADNFRTYLKQESMNLENKEKFIKEIFKLLNGRNANLKNITNNYFKDRTGRLANKTITEGTLYYKSITGLREYKHEF